MERYPHVLENMQLISLIMDLCGLLEGLVSLVGWRGALAILLFGAVIVLLMVIT